MSPWRARLIEPENTRDWSQALSTLPHGPFHILPVLTATNPQPERLGLLVLENAAGRAAWPLVRRSAFGARDVAAPYGYAGPVGVGDLTGAADTAAEWLRAQGFVAAYWRAHPVLSPPALFPEGNETDTAASAFVLPLEDSEAEQVTRVSKRKRSQLRKWLAAAELERDQDRLRTAFVTLYPQHMAQRGAGESYALGDAALEQLCRAPGAHLVGVREGGHVSAVALFACVGEAGEFLFLARDEGASPDAGYGLMFAGARDFAARGVRWCNLGGAIRAGDGVGEAKRRLGGVAAPVPVQKSVLDAQGFAAACGRAGLSVDAGPWFPPYHAPDVRRSAADAA